MKKYNIAILQRVIPIYRNSLFEEISNLPYINLILLYGQDIPNTKVKSNIDKSKKFTKTKHETSFFKFFGRILVWHHGLLKSLCEFKPDLIIAEGESNIISYLQAFFYKCFFKDTKLIHWSIGGLPKSKSKSIEKFLKFLLLRIFDNYIVYSSFGKNELMRNYRIESYKIFVAVNISPIDKLLNNKLKKRNFPSNLATKNFDKNKFTIISSGSLEKEKNFHLIFDALEKLDNNKFNFILLGEGGFKRNLENIVKRKQIQNVYFEGHIPWALIPEYYFISDLFILPGRGGMVISESMACGLPVLLHAADGVEFDLIKDNLTGFFYKKNNSNFLSKKIIEISSNKNLLKKVSKNANMLINQNYSTKKYASSIGNAILKTLNN